MRIKAWKLLVIAGAVIILLLGSCNVYRKTDFAADASFVAERAEFSATTLRKPYLATAAFGVFIDKIPPYFHSDKISRYY